MKSTIIVMSFTTLLYFSAQALYCGDNPCDLGGYFVQPRGYQCIQMNTEALCTCPNGGYEINQPCRVCNRTNPANNSCIASAALLLCLETDDYGATFACLCSSSLGPVVTISGNCDLIVTSTSTPMTTTSTVISSTCSNGGYLVDDICHCPSGYGGRFCERKNDANLCERIICKNRGVCAIRNPNGLYESVCLCRYGTSGDYCQLTGTLGFCKSDLCMNNAPCKETVIGSTRHAYCDCPPGFNGIHCENQYFECISNGKFTDSFMDDQGKYFECTQLNQIYRLEQKSCPKGLRFDRNNGTCTV